MGRNTNQSCKLIMEDIKERGYENAINWDVLAMSIRRKVGSGKPTLAHYRKELQILGFLKSSTNLQFFIQKRKDTNAMQNTL